MSGNAFITTDQTFSATGDAYDVGSGDSIYVESGVSLVDETAAGSIAIDVAGYGYANIEGAVYGETPLFFAGAVGFVSVQVQISSTGSLEADQHAALTVATGDYQITNAGDIQSDGSVAVDLDYNNVTDTRGAGEVSGLFVNTGVVSSASDDAIVDGDTTATVTDTIDNYGQVLAGENGILVLSSHASAINNYGSIAVEPGYNAIEAFGLENLTNAGSIQGNVDVGANSEVVDSGSIYGQLAMGEGTGSLDVVSVTSSGAIDGRNSDAINTGTSAYRITNAGQILAEGAAPHAVALGGGSSSGSGSLINSGKITSSQAVGVLQAAAASADDYLYNSGLISGGTYGVEDTGGHVARIVNAGEISGGAGDYAVYADATTQERLVNSGSISGAVSLGAAGSTIVNSGAIDGNIAFGAGSERVVNTGAIDGSLTFTGSTNVYLGQGGSFTGTVTGSSFDDRFYGGAGDEYFDLQAAGAKVAVGGTGTTTFDYGADFNNSMAVSGGTGTTIVDLEGNYAGANELFLGARTMVGVSKIVLGAGFNYAIVANASSVGDGDTMTVDGSALGSANTLLFDASHDVNGYYDFIGGAGQNTFTFATYNLYANDVVQGGAGAGNILRFITAGDVTSQQMANVSGVSTIKLQAGANDIQLNDFMTTKASGHSLTVNLSTGDDTIDASLLTTATNTVTINAANARATISFIMAPRKRILISARRRPRGASITTRSTTSTSRLATRSASPVSRRAR